MLLSKTVFDVRTYCDGDVTWRFNGPTDNCVARNPLRGRKFEFPCESSIIYWPALSEVRRKSRSDQIGRRLSGDLEKQGWKKKEKKKTKTINSPGKLPN